MWRRNAKRTGSGPGGVPLIYAFGLSLALHGGLFLILELMARAGLLVGGDLTDVVAQALAEDQQRVQEELAFEIEPETLPTEFFDVDPSQATEEKPEETPYYGVVDTVAADDSPDDSQEQPEMDGSQERVLKNTDTLPQEVAVAVPAEALTTEPNETERVESESPAETETLQQPAVSEEPVPESEGTADAMVVEGESEEDPLEYATLRPTVRGVDAIELRDSAFAPKPARPRTLAEARKQQGMLVGEKLKQEGGAKRFRIQSTPNLLSTPFGDYDAKVIQAIQQRWFSILGAMPTARNARGKVVLKFDMRPDGSVTDLDIVEDTVGVIQSLVCQKAISEPAPFGPWPDDMKRMIGTDRREVRFSFFYN